jgi:hypothetical protein
MAKTENSVGWQGSEPFYSHLQMLWNHEAETRWKFNDSHDLHTQLKYLEDWYEGLETLFSRVQGFITPEETEKCQKLFEVIDKKTKGDNFFSCNLTTEEIIVIRRELKIISREIFVLMAKYDMLVKKVYKQVFDDIKEEIDTENV